MTSLVSSVTFLGLVLRWGPTLDRQRLRSGTFLMVGVLTSWVLWGRVASADTGAPSRK